MAERNGSTERAVCYYVFVVLLEIAGVRPGYALATDPEGASGSDSGLDGLNIPAGAFNKIQEYRELCTDQVITNAIRKLPEAYCLLSDDELWQAIADVRDGKFSFLSWEARVHQAFSKRRQDQLIAKAAQDDANTARKKRRRNGISGKRLTRVILLLLLLSLLVGILDVLLLPSEYFGAYSPDGYSVVDSQEGNDRPRTPQD